MTELKFHNCAVNSMSWSPDSTKLLTTGAYDRQYAVWDVYNNNVLFQLQHPANYMKAVSGVWSADGALIATVSDFDTHITIWDANTGKVIKNIDIATIRGTPTALAWSSDSRHLALGSEKGDIFLFSVNEGVITTTLQGASVVRALSWSDDRLISGSGDGTVRIWDSLSNEIALILLGHTGAVNDVAYHADSDLIASGSNDQTTRIWDANSGLELKQFNYPGKVWAVDWSPDGAKIAFGGARADGQDAEIVIEDAPGVDIPTPTPTDTPAPLRRP